MTLVWLLTTVMVAVFIYELVLNAREQGSPISLRVCADYTLNLNEILFDVIARRESNARTVFIRTHQLRCTVPSLYERGQRSTCDPLTSL